MTTEFKKLTDMPDYLKQALDLANLKKSRSQLAWVIEDYKGNIISGSNLLGHTASELITRLKSSKGCKKLYLSCAPFPRCMSYDEFNILIQTANVTEIHVFGSAPKWIDADNVKLKKIHYYDLGLFNQASMLAVKVSAEKNRPWILGMISGDIHGGYSEPSYFLNDPTDSYSLNERIKVTQAVISDDQVFLDKLSNSKNSDDVELLFFYADSNEKIINILDKLQSLKILSVLVVINPDSLNTLIMQGNVDELIVHCKYKKLSSKLQNSWLIFEHLSHWNLSAHHDLNSDTVMNYINPAVYNTQDFKKDVTMS